MTVTHSTTPVTPTLRRRAIPLCLPLIVMTVSLGLAGCGGNPTGPEPPGPPEPTPPSPTPDCRAINYPGFTGGERIQRAIDDQTCTTVYIDARGPDDSGVWLVREPLRLRSGLTLTSTTDAERPTLEARGATWVVVIELQSNIMLRNLNILGAKSALTGVLIRGSSRVTFTMGTIAGVRHIGLYIRDTPSSDITISSSVFEDNGFIDVRTETGSRDAYHSNVVVENNSLMATTYAVTLANCGNSQATRCQVRDNLMKPKRSDPGTGVDLNRSHWALVSGNRILGLGDICFTSVTCKCGKGLTVDDAQNATISSNVIEGCTEEGILLANGAIPANRPWYVSGNTVTNNTVQNNGGVGLASYRNLLDRDDHNIFNVFSNNRIMGNAGGGCRTNAERNTFFGNGPQSCPSQSAATMTR